MDPSIDQPPSPQSAAAAPLPAPPTGEERTDAYLVAASMLGDMPDAFSSAYSAFCRAPVPPLLQLLPHGPAVQTHVTAAPLDRSDWLHQLPGGGLSLAPVCELSSHAQPPQPAAPRDRSSAATSSAETGGPCPGGISVGTPVQLRLPSCRPRCHSRPASHRRRWLTKCCQRLRVPCSEPGGAQWASGPTVTPSDPAHRPGRRATAARRFFMHTRHKY